MDRIAEVSLAGKKYPLNFSVRASRMIDEKYGGLEHLTGVIGWKDIQDAMYNVAWMLNILIEQGIAYRKYMGESAPDPLDMDTIEMLVGAPDLERLQAAILESIGLGSQTTVEVEQEKNAKAARAEDHMSGTTTSGGDAESVRKK